MRQDIQVIGGLGWGLNESARQSMRQAVFLPAIKDGDFVAVGLQKIEFEFKLGCSGVWR